MTQLHKPSWKEERLTEEEPPPLYSINSLFDPFQATPECESRFEIAKWGLRLPEWGIGDVFLEEREVRQIAHQVLTHPRPPKGVKSVNSFLLRPRGWRTPRLTLSGKKFRRTMRGQ